MDKIQQLIDIAHKAREDCEFFLPHYPELGGACGICSLYLLIRARSMGIYVTLAHGFCDDHYHYWIEYNNKIIDITATQFGYQSRVRVKNKNKSSGYIAMDSTRSLSRARQWTQQWLHWIPREMIVSMATKKGKII